VNDPYPRTGSGFTADRNGKLVPEWTVAPNTQLGPGSTMRFRNADGTPMPKTKVINGEPVTASEWTLIPNPVNPDQLMWVPL